MHPEGPRPFTGDFRNTALINYARESHIAGYEPTVTALMDALAPDLAQVYDIGANWGYYVALLMTNPGFDGRIQAFEISRSFRELTAMVAVCGLEGRVSCHAVGLSDRNGSAYLQEGYHSFLTRISATPTGREVPVIRLDDFEGPDPDLLKIDVEGHEAAVLRGGLRRLRRAKPHVIFENWYRPDAIDMMLEPLYLLEREGYRLYQLAWPTGDGGALVYHRDWPSERPASLSLVPLSPGKRPLIPTTLDLVALHPDRQLLTDSLHIANEYSEPSLNWRAKAKPRADV